MHRDEAHAALGDHVAGDGAVDPAGEQRHRHAVGADRHPSRALHRLGVDVGREVANLDHHGQLRLVHVHRAVGVGLRELPAHVLAQLDGGHGKALVAALRLHLEALRAAHIVGKVADGKLRDGVLVLLAGGGAADLHDAEHVLQSLEGGVKIGVLALGLDVDRGLHARHLEFAQAQKPPAHIAHQLLFKALAVETLEHDLAKFT